jgi:GGDEF domain-containing protein
MRHATRQGHAELAQGHLSVQSSLRAMNVSASSTPTWARGAGDRQRRASRNDLAVGVGNRRRSDARPRGRARRPHGAHHRFDLDGVKNYNDVFGHPAGDALLVRLAEDLESVVGTQNLSPSSR